MRFALSTVLLLLSACASADVQQPQPSPEVASPVEASGLAAAGGRVEVIDGDTIAVEGYAERIRLYGIDAPEGQQTCLGADGARYLCGSRAAIALADIVGRNGRARIVERDRDRYGRIVAQAYVDGSDIGGELVRQGWALEYTRYSDGRYAAPQREAQAARRGMWAGIFEEPWTWRQKRRSGQQLAAAVTVSPVLLAAATGPIAPRRSSASPGGLRMAQRRSCKAVSTCREAVVMWCEGYTGADRDRDGIPCENICSSKAQVDAIRREIGC